MPQNSSFHTLENVLIVQNISPERNKEKNNYSSIYLEDPEVSGREPSYHIYSLKTLLNHSCNQHLFIKPGDKLLILLFRSLKNFINRKDIVVIPYACV